MTTIRITIDAKGRAKIEANAYVGDACRTATEPYRNALSQTQVEQTKPELYQDASQSQEQTT